MNTEVKKVSDSWEAKCNSTVEWMSCGERLLEIDGILQECDAILQEVGLGTGFISKRTELEGLLEDKRVLWEYVPMLPDFVNYYLDEPLYKAFNQHATETISRIKLEDFWVDAGENNQIGITESYYDPYLGEYKGSENKTRFTFVDFLGTNTETAHLPNSSGWIVSTSGCVEDFARIFEGQYEAMNAAEMFKETEITSYEEYLEHFAHQGEFNHTMDKPFLSFVSSVLDITIIKPIIEACTGEDLITGEDLSDLERGLKVVFAIVDLVTLGGAVAATKCSEMELKKALQVLGKTVAIEFAGNTAACGVSAIGEAFDWPIPITIMLSLAAGIAVSCKGNKLLFEGEGFSREVLLDDTEVKKIGEMFEGGTYSGDLMSAEEAARYSEHWRELGIGSDKTWKEFMDANPNGTIDDYFEIVQKQSPWPLGETGTTITLKAGDRFFMAVENDAPENVIGGFGVKERIESTDFVRNNLAVKYDWKTSCNVIREFEINSGIELKVNAGPVGPQIDLGADIYLPGDTTITQYDLFSNLGSGIKREDYVHVVDEYWVD